MFNCLTTLIRLCPGGGELGEVSAQVWSFVESQVMSQIKLSVNLMHMMHLLVITSVRVLDSNFHARKLLSSRYYASSFQPILSLAILDV